MKDFFKFTIASMLGYILASFLFVFIMFAIIASVVSNAESMFEDKKTVVKENSILHLKLDDEIIDRGSTNPFDNIEIPGFNTNKKIGLNNILDAIKSASEDEKIKGIYLDLSEISAGLATLSEIRNALLAFKESGKFIIAYSEIFTQGTYYVASVADKVYMYPQGGMIFKGLHTELSFFKGTLEKLDIEMQVIRGKNNKFKSAVEPFMNDKMSDANREQVSKYIHSIWDVILEAVSSSRNVEISTLKEIADKMQIRSPKDGVKYGLLDDLKYADEVIDELKEKVGVTEDKEFKLVSLGKYNKAPKSSKSKDEKDEKPWEKKKDYIAVVFAEGEINSGQSNGENIGSETTAEAIRKARKDTTVKAIVFRVNSPGGSALASDVILREAMLAKQAKPFIVSMGNLAASGGYYISCHADKIFAGENTITGSIGVFGLIPNMQGLFNKKLGITFDRVKTSNFADLGMITRPLSAAEHDIIQEYVEEIYQNFINYVATGRNMSIEKVDSIGQGRVWTGRDALALGLVDEIGGLDAAIKYAAKAAEIEDYKTKSFPEQKDPIKAFFEELSGEAEAKILQKNLGTNYKHYLNAQKVSQLSGVQMLMPYYMEIK